MGRDDEEKKNKAIEMGKYIDGGGSIVLKITHSAHTFGRRADPPIPKLSMM